MDIELKTRVERNKACASAPVDNEIVFLNMQKNHYVALDEIGRRIWDLLEKPSSVEELCQKLSLEFANTPEGIAKDILPFLNELETENIILKLDEKLSKHAQ